LLARARFAVYMYCCVSLFLVVSTSAVDCQERLVSQLTCYVWSGTLNLLSHSLTFPLRCSSH